MVPVGLALDEAVALLADGRTALMLIEAAGVDDGDVVLVEAAAGGVGGLLVQLARAAGATVIAAAGGAAKVEIVRDAGAEIVVDYRADDWDARVRRQLAGNGGVTVVFDGVGGAVARSAFALLDAGGRMVSFGGASGEWADIAAEDAAARVSRWSGCRARNPNSHATSPNTRWRRRSRGGCTRADRAAVPARTRGRCARGHRIARNRRQDAAGGAVIAAASTSEP